MLNEDYSVYFNAEENNWFEKNEIAKDELFEEIQDIRNVNPLDNGEQDLGPLNVAIKATKLIIMISKTNQLEGPYNAGHFKLIKDHLPEINFAEKSFWNLFSFFCANKADEGMENKHRLYLSAIAEILLSDFGNDVDNSNGVVNLDTGELQKIKGEGVNAYLE